MKKEEFAEAWKAFNRNQKRAVLCVVESHKVTGDSIPKVVKDNYQNSDSGFRSVMILAAKCYVKFMLK